MKTIDARLELCTYLDSIAITSDNIGSIRRSLSLPYDSEWNAIVRDETAAREKAGEKKCVVTIEFNGERPLSIATSGMELLDSADVDNLREQIVAFVNKTLDPKRRHL